MDQSGCNNNLTPPVEAVSWKKRLFFSALIIIFLAGLFVLLEEAAKRVYPRLPENGRSAVESLRNKNDTSRTGEYLQHPYLFYVYRPGYRGQFNSLGHRNPEVTPVPAPGVLRILCIGGSTTISFPYVPEVTNAWPIKLGERIAQETGIQTEVINAGLNGANSADLLAHYMFRNRYLKPHIVVIHVGGNDGSSLLFPDYNPEYTHYITGWRNTSLAPRPFERALLNNHIARCFYAWWLKDVSIDAEIGRGCIPDITAAECLKNAKKNEPTGFRRNLELIVQNIIQDKAVPVLFQFVPAPVGKFRAEYKEYTDPLLLGFEKNNAVLEEISKKYDIKLVKLPDGAIPDDLFKDWCHVRTEGDAIKADYLAKSLVPLVQKMIAQGTFTVTNNAAVAFSK